MTRSQLAQIARHGAAAFAVDPAYGEEIDRKAYRHMDRAAVKGQKKN